MLTFIPAKMFARSADLTIAQIAQREREMLLPDRTAAQIRQCGFGTLMTQRITEIDATEFDHLFAESAFAPEYEGVRRSLNLLTSLMNDAISPVPEAADDIQRAEATLGRATRTCRRPP